MRYRPALRLVLPLLPALLAACGGAPAPSFPAAGPPTSFTLAGREDAGGATGTRGFTIALPKNMDASERLSSSEQTWIQRVKGEPTGLAVSLFRLPKDAVPKERMNTKCLSAPFAHTEESAGQLRIVCADTAAPKDVSVLRYIPLRGDLDVVECNVSSLSVDVRGLDEVEAALDRICLSLVDTGPSAR